MVHRSFVRDGRRMQPNLKTVMNQCNAEINVASVEQDSEQDRLSAVESVLIYAHSAPYCSKCIQNPSVPVGGLRIWNSGSYARLMPEISSLHPWYRVGG
jgi:hypothetical protein